MANLIKLLKQKSTHFETTDGSKKHMPFLYADNGMIGFPSEPNCIAFDYLLKICALGTKNGCLYLLGPPGLVSLTNIPFNSIILQLIFIEGKQLIIVVLQDALLLYNYTNCLLENKPLVLIKSYELKLCEFNLPEIDNSNTIVGYNSKEIISKNVFYLSKMKTDIYKFNIDVFELTSIHFVDKILNIVDNEEICITSLASLYSFNKAIILVAFKKHVFLFDHSKEILCLHHCHQKEIMGITIQPNYSHSPNILQSEEKRQALEFLFLIGDKDGKITCLKYMEEISSDAKESLDFISQLQNENKPQLSILGCLSLLDAPRSRPITKLGWIPYNDKNNLIGSVIIIAGGMPKDGEFMDKNTVALLTVPNNNFTFSTRSPDVMNIFETSTAVIDFIPIINKLDSSNSLSSEPGSLAHHQLMLLCQEEWICLILSSFQNNSASNEHRRPSLNRPLCELLPLAKPYELEAPYLTCLHSSAITCIQLSDDPLFVYQLMYYLEQNSLLDKEIFEEWPISGLVYDSALHISNSNKSSGVYHRIFAPLRSDHVKKVSLSMQKGRTLETPCDVEILFTGHEDGSVKIWTLPLDKPNTAVLILTLKTNHLFPNGDSEHDIVQNGHEEEEEEENTAAKSIGIFDPFSDDPRYAIRKIEILNVNPLSSFIHEKADDNFPEQGGCNKWILGVGGAAGQCFIIQDFFELLSQHGDILLNKKNVGIKPYPNSVMNGHSSTNDKHAFNVHWLTSDLVKENSKFVWKGQLPLYDAKSTTYHNTDKGSAIASKKFDNTIILGIQIYPPAAITLISFSPESGLLCLGTSHGFAIIDLLFRPNISTEGQNVNCISNSAILFNLSTLDETNEEASGDTALSIKKSLKKSLRQSFRRLRLLRNAGVNKGDDAFDGDQASAFKQLINSQLARNITSSFRRKHNINPTLESNSASSLTRQGSKWVDLSTERCIEARPAVSDKNNNNNNTNNVASLSQSKINASSGTKSSTTNPQPTNGIMKCAHFYDQPPQVLVVKNVAVDKKGVSDDRNNINSAKDISVIPNKSFNTRLFNVKNIRSNLSQDQDGQLGLDKNPAINTNSNEIIIEKNNEGAKMVHKTNDLKINTINECMKNGDDHLVTGNKDRKDTDTNQNYTQRTTLWMGNASGTMFVYQIDTNFILTPTPNINNFNNNNDINGTLNNNIKSVNFSGKPIKIVKREVRLIKEMHLKHGAPIIAILRLENDIFSKPPTKKHDHFDEIFGVQDKISTKSRCNKPSSVKLLIVSEEQIKIFLLPNLKPLTKYRLTALEGSLIRKVFWSHFLIPANQIVRSSQNNTKSQLMTSPLKYSKCLVTLSNHGELCVFNPLTLRRLYHHTFTRKEDVNGIGSFVMLLHGQAYYMDSSRQVKRISFSPAYTSHLKNAVKSNYPSLIAKVVKNTGGTSKNNSTRAISNDLDNRNNDDTIESSKIATEEPSTSSSNDLSGLTLNDSSENVLVDTNTHNKNVCEDTFYKEARSICQKQSLNEMKKALMRRIEVPKVINGHE